MTKRPVYKWAIYLLCAAPRDYCGAEVVRVLCGMELALALRAAAKFLPVFSHHTHGS
jgi:hypothetical protein